MGSKVVDMQSDIKIVNMNGLLLDSLTGFWKKEYQIQKVQQQHGTRGSWFN